MKNLASLRDNGDLKDRYRNKFFLFSKTNFKFSLIFPFVTPVDSLTHSYFSLIYTKKTKKYTLLRTLIVSKDR